MNMTQRRKVAELIARRVDKFKSEAYKQHQRDLQGEREVFDAQVPDKVVAAVDTINAAVKAIVKANELLAKAGYHVKHVQHNFDEVLDVSVLQATRPASKLTEPNHDQLDESIDALELKLWIAGDLEAEQLLTELETLLK